MSCSPTPSTPAESQKPSFINETESLSLMNLIGKEEDLDVNPATPSNSKSNAELEKRGECLVAKSAASLNNRKSFPVSILRKESESREVSSSARKRIVWGDKAKLETRFFYPPEEDDIKIPVAFPAINGKTNCPRKKKNGVVEGTDEDMQMGMSAKYRSDRLDLGAPNLESNFDDELSMDEMEVENYDGDIVPPSLESSITDTSKSDDKDDGDIIPPEMEETPKKAPKRKYQRKKKPEIEEPAKTDEDAALVMNDGDSDNETLLMIDEGDENTEGVEAKKGKKRKSAQELRREKEEAIRENEAILARLNVKKVKTAEELNDEFEALTKMVSHTTNKKERKIRASRKSEEDVRREIEKELMVDDPVLVQSKIQKKEKEVYDEWTRKFLSISPKEDPMIKELDAEADAYAERKKKERRGELDDMPDFDDLVMQYNKFKMNPLDSHDTELEDICVEPKEKVTKKKVVEKKEVKKKSGGNGGSNKKKKEEKEHSIVPQTEEEKEKEILAEIEKKKADAAEKATRMKQQKIEDKERKRIERENKKEEEEKVREAKKIMKNNERNIMERKPKSRAEAARRTKALLAMEKGDEKSAAEEDEDDEPKRKKRKYRKRTKPVSFIRRIRNDDVESEIGCGKYIENPCDMCDEDEWTNLPYEDEDSDEDNDIDEVLSVPFLWTSEEDTLAEGDIGPLNFDPDEQMKRHVNDTEKFSDGLTSEYHDMVEHLDGMKLNLFADTTLRRFDHRVVHNIDSLATMRAWPIDLIPQPSVAIPIHRHHLWNKPFEGLVRIRPLHKKKDQLTSKQIDEMSGGNIETVTENDILMNLEELIMSKLKKTNWTPLPSAHNPFDIPEISTRNESRAVVDYNSVPYVHKHHVQSIPCENNNKKRKKTRKEVLQEIATKPRPAVGKREDIYKEEEEREGDEEDGYKFAWNEMGEMIDNPMRDNRMEEDPFATANPYEGMEYDDDEVASGENGLMEESQYNHEKEDETQLGEAFSFMAAHIDV